MIDAEPCRKRRWEQSRSWTGPAHRTDTTSSSLLPSPRLRGKGDANTGDTLVIDVTHFLDVRDPAFAALTDASPWTAAPRQRLALGDV